MIYIQNHKASEMERTKPSLRPTTYCKMDKLFMKKSFKT